MQAKMFPLKKTLPQGLTLIPNFITDKQSQALIAEIDAQEWDKTLSRRVQHYGYKYDYRNQQATPTIEPPKSIRSIASTLLHKKITIEKPNQFIVNEYNLGQGISTHTDVPIFDNTIVSLSLLSGITMTFREKGIGTFKDMYLKPNSLLIMEDKARYDWTHEIVPRRVDIVHGSKILRKRRISITFRTVIS